MVRSSGHSDLLIHNFSMFSIFVDDIIEPFYAKYSSNYVVRITMKIYFLITTYVDEQKIEYV